MSREKPSREVTDAQIYALELLMEQEGKSRLWLAEQWKCGASWVTKRLNYGAAFPLADLKLAYERLNVTDADFAELTRQAEWHIALRRVGVPPPATAMDFAEVRARMREIEQERRSGAYPGAEALLYALAGALGDVPPMDVPWVDYLAGMILNEEDAVEAAEAFKRAADGFYRLWLGSRYQAARSYARAASRLPKGLRADELRRFATQEFQAATLTRDGDPKIWAEVCKSHAELLEPEPVGSEECQKKMRLYEAAEFGYLLALDDPRHQSDIDKATCHYNRGYCRYRQGKLWPAIAEYLLSLEIRTTLPKEEPGVAYVLKYLAKAHSDLALAVREKEQRAAHHGLAGWCVIVSERIYEAIRRTRRHGRDPEARNWDDFVDLKIVKRTAFERNPIQANRLYPTIPEFHEIPPDWVLSTYREHLGSEPALHDVAKQFLSP